MRNITALVSAVALTVSPVLAAPAFAAPTNAASSLSVAKARAGTSVSKKNDLAGGGAIFAAIIAAGIAAIGVVAIVNDNEDDSDSN